VNEIDNKEVNEIDNLEMIKGVGKATAEKFRRAGYKTLSDVAKTTPKGLARKTKIPSTIAKEIVKTAKQRMETTVAKPVFKPTDIKTTLLKDILPSVLEDYKAKEEISTVAQKVVKTAKQRMETTVAKPVFKPTDTKTTLLKDVLPSVLEDYKFKEEILKEIAKEVSDLLEDDPVLRGKVIKAALQKPEFRSRVANYVVKELT